MERLHAQAQLNSKHHVSGQVEREASIGFSLLRMTQRMAVYQPPSVSQEFKAALKVFGKVRIQLIPLGNWEKPKLSSELSVGVPISYSKLMTLYLLFKYLLFMVLQTYSSLFGSSNTPPALRL
jgi:hypothetical protein